VWAKRPKGKLPNVRRQAALIEWLTCGPLAAHEPKELLYRCLHREPRLFARASSLRRLQESHATLARMLREDLSPKRVADAVAKDPELLLVPPAELIASAAAIAAATGLDDEALERAIRVEPGLLLSTSESISLRLIWLRDRLGIAAGGRLARVVSRAPLVLKLSLPSLEARASCLEELGVSGDLLGAVVVRTPRLLHTPLGTIRAKARWLEQVDVLDPSDGGAHLAAFIRRQPDFWSLPTRRCNETLAWLISLQLDERRAASVIAAEPSVLSMPLEALQLRASFFFRVLRGTPAELSQVPQMLTADLAKVPLLRHAYCLTNGLIAKPTDLLIKGDAQFCNSVVGCDLSELNDFEADGKHLTFFQGAEM